MLPLLCSDKDQACVSTNLELPCSVSKSEPLPALSFTVSNPNIPLISVEEKFLKQKKYEFHYDNADHN